MKGASGREKKRGSETKAAAPTPPLGFFRAQMCWTAGAGESVLPLEPGAADFKSAFNLVIKLVTLARTRAARPRPDALTLVWDDANCVCGLITLGEHV